MVYDTNDHELPREGVVPDPEEKARVRCTECDVEFLRREVGVTKKGTLTCPDCGSRKLASVE